MFDELHDGEFDDGESWKSPQKERRVKKKLKTNPDGPYEIDLIFSGIEFNIVIENITHDDFKVIASTDADVKKDKITALKHYLETEGFQEEARKHNLFW
jgi:hypothetical protein